MPEGLGLSSGLTTGLLPGRLSGLDATGLFGRLSGLTDGFAEGFVAGLVAGLAFCPAEGFTAGLEEADGLLDGLVTVWLLPPGRAEAEGRRPPDGRAAADGLRSEPVDGRVAGDLPVDEDERLTDFSDDF